MAKMEPKLDRMISSSSKNPDKKRFKEVILDYFKQNSPFFGCFSREFIDYLFTIGEFKTKEAQETLVSANDICKTCSILLYGIQILNLGHNKIAVTHGSCVGEEAILRPTRTSIHQSSVRALTRTCYLELGP